MVLPIIDCCQTQCDFLNCINGTQGVTKCSSKGYNSNLGGFGGNPILLYIDNFGGFSLEIAFLQELHMHSILSTDIYPI